MINWGSGVTHTSSKGFVFDNAASERLYVMRGKSSNNLIQRVAKFRNIQNSVQLLRDGGRIRNLLIAALQPHCVAIIYLYKHYK